MQKEANILARKAFWFEVICLLLWPVIWALLAFSLSGWWVIGGFTIGLLVSIALSLIPATMGILAVKRGTEFRFQALLPSFLLGSLLLCLAVWYGVEI